METTEKIVEAHCRYVRRWATIPNIRCGGQREIDLLAIDLGSSARWHIEVGVSISSFAALTDGAFNDDTYKNSRVDKAGLSRTLGYFLERKFRPPEVQQALRDHGCDPAAIQRAIVTWGWRDGVQARALAEGVHLWDFRRILRDLGDQFRGKSGYFTDDTLRTLQLYALAAGEGGLPGSR